MDMNIQKYMAFVKTVESGSFTKAAQLLQYSQSGISRMINDLENLQKSLSFFWKKVLIQKFPNFFSHITFLLMSPSQPGMTTLLCLWSKKDLESASCMNLF